jgi:16S rRNA (uracil1498-N3)-methyltransferase
MPCFYLPGIEGLPVGSKVRMEGEEFHHLVHVAHRRTQDAVRLNSGMGTLAWADLQEINRSFAVLDMTDVEMFPADYKGYAIAFSLLKNRNDEMIVEKCTELGAKAFFPLQTSFSVRQAAGNTIERFERIALAAIKQCDNPWLPSINMVLSLDEGLEAIKEAGYDPVLCSERRPDVWLADLNWEKYSRPCFLIGPEGGWSGEEFKALDGLPEITFSHLITRAETAAIAISAQWLAYANQFKTTGTT